MVEKGRDLKKTETGDIYRTERLVWVMLDWVQ